MSTTIKGLDKVLKNLKAIRKALKSDIDYLFINKSLDWILLKANENLDGRTHHFWGSEARSWTKKIYKTFGLLENDDMNSASIEFGIGRVGLYHPTTSAFLSTPEYEYDKPSIHKDVDGKWTFKDARTGIWVTFNGYEGKSFLYDAFSEYMMDKIWIKLYQEAFDEIVKKVI